MSDLKEGALTALIINAFYRVSRHIDEADRKQLLNYMRCSTIELGLLLHFGPKPAFHRFVFDNDRKHGLQVVVNG